MANRYLNLFKLPERLYAKGSPIIIEAGALHKDSVLSDVVAQLKFRSIVPQNITSLTVDITCFDAAKEIITPSFIYKYENIIVNENEQFFGNKTLITLPENSTRSFEVKITKVEFSDGSTVSVESNDWNSIPKQDDLSSFDNVFLKYFRQKYGNAAIFLPAEYEDLWLCTCGQENKSEKTLCSCCDIKYSDVFPFEVEQEKKNAIYEFAKKKMNSCLYEEAIELFESIIDWKDAEEQISTCQRKIETSLSEEKAKKKKEKTIVGIVASVACIAIAFIIVLNTVIIPNGKYNDAIVLMNEGKYEEAIAVFEALDGYKDSADQITNCNVAIIDGRYNDAIALLDSDIVKAYESLIALDGYKDSEDKANSIFEEYKDKKLKNANVGDYIFFGAYEQDNNISNGKENLMWQVLEVKENRALLISKYIIENKEYNKENISVKWEKCTLRNWLNNDFLNTSFSEEEKIAIQITTIPSDEYSKYNTKYGNITDDKVFILSYSEFLKYIPKDKWFGENAEYWAETIPMGRVPSMCFRTPGVAGNCIMSVSYYEELGISGEYWVSATYGIRPAMWIDLSKIK